jgi:hypothetical protein
VALDLSGGHAARIQRQNFFVEAREARLMLFDQPRLELAFAIAWRL